MKTFILMTALFALSAPLSFAQGGGSTAGVGNPASRLCIQKGGKLEIVRTEAGEMGICSFGDAQIEEWTLLREFTGDKGQALKIFAKAPGKIKLPKDSARPEIQFCSRVGGLVEIALKKGGSLPLCRFKDRSTISALTLYYGAQHQANSQLAELLGLK